MALNNVNKVSFHHFFSSTLHVKCCERKHTQCVTGHDRPPRKVMHRYRPDTSRTGAPRTSMAHVVVYKMLARI